MNMDYRREKDLMKYPRNQPRSRKTGRYMAVQRRMKKIARPLASAEFPGASGSASPRAIGPERVAMHAAVAPAPPAITGGPPPRVRPTSTLRQADRQAGR